MRSLHILVTSFFTLYHKTNGAIMRLVTTTLFLSLLGCRSDDGLQKFNSTPEANITSHVTGDAVTEGFSVLFIGTGSDANHATDELTAIWYSGSDIICESTTLPADGTTSCEKTITMDDSEITLVVKDPESSSGEAKVTLDIVPSDAPTASIYSPSANGVFYSDLLITFEGAISDNEDEIDALEVTWNSNLDGDLNVATEPNGSGELVGAEYLTEGEHFIVLTVTDSSGKEGTDNVTIRVGPPNSAPLCEITEPLSLSAGAQGELVVFAATADDVDIPEDMLSASWRSDKDGELGTSSVNSDGSISFPFSELSVNTHVITLSIADEVGATCTSSVTYTVGTAPSITLDAPLDGNVYSEGQTLTFAATVSDAQDQPDDILLDWVLNGSSFSTQSATTSGTAEFSDSTLSAGTYNLMVTATDSDGLTDSDQINFTVNGLPSQPFVSITPSPADTNDTLTVNIDSPSTDPEGNTVNYSFSWLMGGAVQSAYTSSTVPSAATNKNEQWTVRVTPNDGIADGPTGEATITIENTAPSLSSLAITPANNIYNDGSLNCTVVVTDPDETLTANYEWSIGTTVVGSGTNLALSTIGAEPNDVVVCTASVVDSDGASASASTSITVENRSPTVLGATITPSNGVTTQTVLSCAATVSDDDGESLSVTYEWQSGTNSYSGASLALDNTMVSPGDIITCIVTAEDGHGGTASDSATVNVQNTLPTVSASISTNGTTNTGELTCIASATDIDDHPTIPTLAYEWFDPSGASLGSSNPLQLDQTVGSDGDNISCVVTATDVSGGVATDTVFHTITNTPPFIDSVLLNPTSIDVNTNQVACNVTASDADGDAISFAYVWLIDGVSQSETSDTLVTTWIAGTAVTCQVTPNDGKVDGDMSQASVVVTNSIPTVDSVTLTPSMVYTNDTITAIGVFSDDDTSQTVTGYYAWHVIDFMTGTDTEVQAGSDNTLSGVSYFNRDDEVYVVVTPNDGTDDGLPLSSSSIAIANTAPTAPGVLLSPDPAVAGQDDLNCFVSTPSVDIDGDTVVYTYVWTDDNGTIQQTTTDVASTTDIFSGSSTTEGTWTCEVTPYDMTDYGASETSSSLVEEVCQDDYMLTFSGGSTGTCCCTGGNSGNSYILADVSPSLSGASTGTIEFWLKLDTYTQYGTIFRSDGTGNAGMGITNTSDCGYGSNRYKTNGGWGGVGVFSSNVATLGAWQHYAVVFNSGTVSYFVDGVLQGTATSPSSTTPNIPNDWLYFGGSYPSSNGNNQHQVNGSYRGIRISSSARYSGNFTPEETLLADGDTMHLYSLDEGTGYTIYDSVDSSMSGTIINGSKASEGWSMYYSCP